MSWMEQIIPDQFDEDILPFWDGLREGRFLLHRCRRCGSSYWPMAYCRHHEPAPGREEMEWAPSSGRGHVFTWVIVHQVWDRAYGDDLPYALVLVELEEGPLFPTRLVGCDPHDVRVGLPVEVTFEHVAPSGLTLPLFRPRTG